MMSKPHAGMVQRFLLSVCIGWFGSVIPVLMSGMVRSVSWGARLLLPDWIVHGSFAVLLLLWIGLMLSLLKWIWTPSRAKVTIGHRDQRVPTAPEQSWRSRFQIAVHGDLEGNAGSRQAEQQR